MVFDVLLYSILLTSETLSMEVRLAVIDEFTQQVLACDYSKEQTKRIVTARGL